MSATAVTSAVAPRVARDGPPLIRAEGIWKIFGPRGERLLGTDDVDVAKPDEHEPIRPHMRPEVETPTGTLFNQGRR